MTYEEMKVFEMWMLAAYQANSNVPFTIVAQALKILRNNVK